MIVDKVKSLCDAMTDIFRSEADIDVVGTAVSAKGAMAHWQECDVVLVTADLPADGALEVARAAAERNPSAQVVLMDWAGTQDAFYQYALAGVAAYSLQDDSVEDLLEKMRQVHQAKAEQNPSVDLSESR